MSKSLAHLFWGQNTQQDFVDSLTGGTSSSQPQTCKHGHPLWGINWNPGPCDKCEDEKFEEWFRKFAGHDYDEDWDLDWTNGDLRIAWRASRGL